MRAQLTWTLMTELLVMAAGIFVLKLAAQLLGSVGFGEYTVSRRAVGLMYLPLVLGLGIATPRYIAIARAGALPGYNPKSFAIATLIAGLTPAAIVILLMNLNPGGASTILFGSSSMQSLIRPSAIALGGLTLHSMVYAIFRGRGDMHFANALSLIDNGIVPVAAFLLVAHNAAAVLTTTGAAWLVISAIALVVGLATESITETTETISAHAKTLLKFGMPRIPGEFALVGLFALPALIALRTQGVVSAGHLSAGMSLTSLVAGVFGPVGLVMLPRASAQAAQGDLKGLRQIVLKMLGAGLAIAIAVVVVGEVLIPPFVKWYFGPAFLPAIPVFRTCLLGAIPYVVYVLLRNILDALDVRAVNSRNLIITLVFLLILCFLKPDIMSMSISLLASLTLLGILSLWETQVRLGRRALAPAPSVPVTVPQP
jgi:O-antigen/teichoic acid export membrane protein